jgi:hypothetical protein
MQTEPEISGESSSPNLFPADKNGLGFKSDFTPGVKMQTEPEISGANSSPNLLSAEKRVRVQIGFCTRGKRSVWVRDFG